MNADSWRARVALADSQPLEPQPDPVQQIHEALRHALAETLARVTAGQKIERLLAQLQSERLLDALVALGFLDREGEGGRAIYLNTREGADFLDGSSAGYLGGVLEEACRKPCDLWKNLTPRPRARKPPRSSAGAAGVWAEGVMDAAGQAACRDERERLAERRDRSAGHAGRLK